jgi:hypothetical protein
VIPLTEAERAHPLASVGGLARVILHCEALQALKDTRVRGIEKEFFVVRHISKREAAYRQWILNCGRGKT